MNRIFLSLLFSGWILGWAGPAGQVASAQAIQGCLFRGDWPALVPASTVGRLERLALDRPLTQVGAVSLPAPAGPSTWNFSFYPAAGTKCWLSGQASLVRSLNLQHRVESNNRGERPGSESWLGAYPKQVEHLKQQWAAIQLVAEGIAEEAVAKWEEVLCIRAAQLAVESENRWEMYWAYYEACDCWIPGYWESLSGQEQWQFLQPSLSEQLLSLPAVDFPDYLGARVLKVAGKAAEMADFAVVRLECACEKLNAWRLAANWQRVQNQIRSLLTRFAQPRANAMTFRDFPAPSGGSWKTTIPFQTAARWTSEFGKQMQQFTAAVAGCVRRVTGVTLEVMSRFPVEAIGRLHAD